MEKEELFEKKSLETKKDVFKKEELFIKKSLEEKKPLEVVNNEITINNDSKNIKISNFNYNKYSNK